MALLSLITEQSAVPCFPTILLFLGDHFRVSKKKSGDHFWVGIILGSIWRSFQGWESFRGWDHFGGCTIVLWLLSEVVQHMLTLTPEIIVICFSSWLLDCGKTRQHCLLPPLHLGNCACDKEPAAAQIRTHSKFCYIVTWPLPFITPNCCCQMCEGILALTRRSLRDLSFM